jgi:hypothetical protein
MTLHLLEIRAASDAGDELEEDEDEDDDDDDDEFDNEDEDAEDEDEEEDDEQDDPETWQVSGDSADRPTLTLRLTSVRENA